MPRNVLAPPRPFPPLPDDLASSTHAALLRIARRIRDGYEGEIIVSVKQGGIRFIRWTQTEFGDTIKEELG